MQISLYKFAKKINSTARPSGNGTVVEARIKQNVPVANSFDQSADTYLTMPVFFLSTVDGSVSQDVNAYNYVRAWGKYYWINNIEIGINGALVLYCQIDVLATHKDSIVGSQQFVSYGSKGYDLHISDSRNLLSTQASYWNMGNAEVIPLSSSGDAVPLPVLNSNYYVTLTCDQGTNIYYMTSSQYNTFIKTFVGGAFNTENNWASVFGAPIYAIGAIKRSSVAPGQFTSEREEVTLGGVSLGSFRRYVPESMELTKQATLQFPIRYITYTDGAKFSEYFIYLPYGGLVKLDASRMCAADRIRILTAIDYTTLDVSYVVEAYNGSTTAANSLGIVGQAKGNCGCDVAFGQIINPNDASAVYYDYGAKQAAADLVGSTVDAGIKSAMLGNPDMFVRAGASGVISSLTEIYKAELNSEMSGFRDFTQRSQIIGGPFTGNNGAFWSKNAVLMQIKHNPMYSPESVSSVMGLPVNKIRTIADDDGFIQCPNPIITLDTVSDVITRIITLMKGGIYVE